MSGTGRLGVVDALVLSGVAALPWFWGGTDLASTRLVAALLAAAGAWLAVRESARAIFPRRSRALWLTALALAGLGALQSTPLPEPLVAAVSPEAHRKARESYPVPGAPGAAWLGALERDAREAVPEASAAAPPAAPARPAEPAPGARRFLTLSLAPDTTREMTFWFVALYVAFAVISRRCRDAFRFEAYQTAMFALFTTLAVVSLANRLTAPATILWLGTAPVDAKPFGPYVNATHFAGAMELGVPWMMGYSFSRLARRGRGAAPSATTILATFGWIVGFVAAIVAASKTAALLLLASASVLLVRALRQRRPGRLRVGAVVAALAAVAVLVVVSGSYLGERVAAFRDIYGESLLTNDRLIAWRAALPMVADYWAVGSGLGAFVTVFPSYLPAGEPGIWGQAHSDWLELAAGGGALGLALVLALLAVYARRLQRAIRTETASRGALVGAALGLGALTLHALVDFNHQIPANALLFVATAAWASSRSESGEETDA